MKRFISTLCAILALAAPVAPVLAQSASQPRMGPLGTHAEDCSLASQPALCQARLRVDTACGELKGAERRKCRADLKPVASCKKAKDAAACTRQQQAHEACKDKGGAEFRACMGTQLGAPGK